MASISVAGGSRPFILGRNSWLCVAGYFRRGAASTTRSSNGGTTFTVILLRFITAGCTSVLQAVQRRRCTLPAPRPSCDGPVLGALGLDIWNSRRNPKSGLALRSKFNGETRVHWSRFWPKGCPCGRQFRPERADILGDTGTISFWPPSRVNEPVLRQHNL